MSPFGLLVDTAIWVVDHLTPRAMVLLRGAFAIEAVAEVAGGEDLVVLGEVTLESGVIHHYSSVTVRTGGTLTTTGWNGNSGGVLRLYVAGAVEVEVGGRIDVSGKGFRGPEPLSGCATAHTADVQGESYLGEGHCVTSPNGGGGGGGVCSGTYGSAGGGGGGYGTAGAAAAPNTYNGPNNRCPGGQGGWVYSNAELEAGLMLGSGGGAGKLYNNPGGGCKGGNGGGAVEIAAWKVVVRGEIRADGEAGGAGGPEYASGGGGGSGGTILIRTHELENHGTISCVGGQGGHCNEGTYRGISSNGGAGGVGRTRLDVDTFNVQGTFTPAVGCRLSCPLETREIRDIVGAACDRDMERLRHCLAAGDALMHHRPALSASGHIRAHVEHARRVLEDLEQQAVAEAKATAAAVAAAAELAKVRRRAQHSPADLHLEYAAVCRRRLSPDQVASSNFLPPGVASVVQCLKREQQVDSGGRLLQWTAGAGDRCPSLQAIQDSRSRLMQAQGAVRSLAGAASPASPCPDAAQQNAEALAEAKAERNRVRSDHTDLLSARLGGTESAKAVPALDTRIAAFDKALREYRGRREAFVLDDPARVAQNAINALEAFDAWLATYCDAPPAQTTDQAIDDVHAALRVLVTGHAFLRSGGSEDATAGCEDLNRRLVVAGLCVKEEEQFWAAQDPLSDLPAAQLRAAAEEVLALMRLERNLLFELDDLKKYEREQEPVELSKALTDARKVLRRTRRAVVTARTTLEGLIDDEGEDEEIEQARHRLHDAQQAARAADEAVTASIVALSAVERHWPEVAAEVGTGGMPSELMPLWRADRNVTYYDSYEALPEAATRPGNRVMRACRAGQTTVVKEFEASTAASLRTCLREARLLRRLRHPAIVEVLSLFQYTRAEGGAAVFCMEMPHYDNGRLDQWIASARSPAAAVRATMAQVLGALQHLHAHGVVHRDLKPANVLVDAAGRPRVADFDISVDTAERTTVAYTRGTATLMQAQGTEGFMAPELGVSPATAASDMYSFGRTLEAVVGDDAAGQELVALLTADDPRRRPTAEEAIRHEYFSRAWAWTREQRRTCCICLDADVPLSTGIECTNTKGPVAHFVCSPCLAGHVREESAADLRLIAKRDARVFCPMRRAKECNACEYSDGDIALHLRDTPGAFAVYIEARQRLLEQRIAQNADERMRAELARLVTLDEQERKVLHARNHIIEEIVNCRCPRCHQTFIDFEGCFALTCSRCPCGFCGWCGEDSGGTDAHAHVARCQHKPPGADTFFGTEQEFREAQDRRRRRELRHYLDSLDEAVRTEVLGACAGELRGLV